MEATKEEENGGLGAVEGGLGGKMGVCICVLKAALGPNLLDSLVSHHCGKGE